MMRFKKGELGFGTVILFIIIVLIVGGIFAVKLNYVEKPNIDIKSSFDKIINNVPDSLSTPPTEYDWCRIQLMDSTQYIHNKILGWDNNNKCCVQEYYGYDSCLQRNIKVQRCYIGDIGTLYKWAKVDGYFLKLPAQYKKFSSELNKNNTECSNIEYPEELK